MPDSGLSIGINGLSYQGVRATTPPQMLVMERAPTTTDGIDFVLGTHWWHINKNNPQTSVLWILASTYDVVAGVNVPDTAVWVRTTHGGDITLPDHSVVLGTGVPGLDSVGPEVIIGYVLTSNGVNADPTFQAPEDIITLPNHSVALGTGVLGLNSTGPIATLGAPLVSNGIAADPTFGVASVSGGGTGLNDCDPYSVYCGGTTGEGPLQQVAGLGNAGEVLTSQGAANLPVWSAAGAGGAGGPIAVQVFTAGAGNCTFSAGMGSCIVEIVGGGAGGESATGGQIGGNGGGSGGYVRKFYLAATVGATQAYSVGAGGASDLAGGDTTFGAGGTLITGSGGAAAAGSATPGIGGVAAGGDVNVQGGSGGISIQFGAVANGSFSGCGGASIYGNGAPARGESSGVGNVGTVYGSGGSGGVDLTGAGNQLGGAGAGGIVIVTEFGPYGILPPIAATTINTIIYDTPGANTYTPTVGMTQVEVECLGGGGAGGGVAGTGDAGGGGGGASGYCKKLFAAAAIGASQNYFIGTGGVGVNFHNGGNGTATTFGTIVIMTASGGIGGQGSVNNSGLGNGGAGGAATGGDLNIIGQTGSAGNGASGIAFGGQGGSTIYGGGGIGGCTSALSFPSAGTGYGAGGGACGAASAQAFPGGSGASGVIIITEYLS
jgi:hypothetical protein